MNNEIEVFLVKMGRKNWYMRWRDPDTGNYVVESTGQSDEAKARKKVGEQEAKLREGRYSK